MGLLLIGRGSTFSEGPDPTVGSPGEAAASNGLEQHLELEAAKNIWTNDLSHPIVLFDVDRLLCDCQQYVDAFSGTQQRSPVIYIQADAARSGKRQAAEVEDVCPSRKDGCPFRTENSGPYRRPQRGHRMVSFTFILPLGYAQHHLTGRRHTGMTYSGNMASSPKNHPVPPP